MSIHTNTGAPGGSWAVGLTVGMLKGKSSPNSLFSIFASITASFTFQVELVPGHTSPDNSPAFHSEKKKKKEKKIRTGLATGAQKQIVNEKTACVGKRWFCKGLNLG